MAEEQESNNKSNVPKTWLRYVSEQSWEPELLISGLAIYATLQMPEMFYNAYQYFVYNLQISSGVFDVALPLLVYSVFTTVSYILFAAFITHFVVRAFWVGFIGLMSVYKDGIRFDDLPYSDFYKKQAHKELGTSEHMALKLDNISSLIFSIAFMMVLIMVAIAIAYLVFFLLYNVLKIFLGPDIFEIYASVLSYSILAIIIINLVANGILNMKRFQSNPRMARWYFNLNWKVSAFIMPLVYKPIMYIQLTFLSNISTKRFRAFGVFFFLVFTGILASVMVTTEHANILDTRNYFATRSPMNTVEWQEYSSNLQPDDFLQNAAIEKPVVSTGLLKVFIPYPKRLDVLLNQFCSTNKVPDSLNKYKRRRIINEQNIACAERFFSFSVDDSVQLQGKLIFTKHPVTKQEGYQSYLNVGKLNSGRHTFYVHRKAVNGKDSTRIEEGRPLRFESEIPFWVE